MWNVFMLLALTLKDLPVGRKLPLHSYRVTVFNVNHHQKSNSLLTCFADGRTTACGGVIDDSPLYVAMTEVPWFERHKAS